MQLFLLFKETPYGEKCRLVFADVPHFSEVRGWIVPYQEKKIYSLRSFVYIFFFVPMRIQKLSHSTYSHSYHIVWGTKYRRRFLKPYVKESLLKLLNILEEEHPTLHFETVNVDEDHVHMQIEIAPTISVSSAMQKIKTFTSRNLRKEFKFIEQIYLEKEGIWSVGYFSSTIWLNEGTIRRYIEQQWKADYPSPETSFGFESP